MQDLISIPEAAARLNLSHARVRAMAARGQLPAAKIADRWVVERSVVEQRRKQKTPTGRRFTPQNAWAILTLASGEDAPQLDPSVRSRFKRALALEGLQTLAPRLRDRAEVFMYKAHPGEVPYVLEDEALVQSGISAAGPLEFGLVSGREADGYVARSNLRGLIAQHALSPAGIDCNVRLRVVPADVWSNLKGRPLAPRAAVALDLADEFDPRSKAAGEEALREIDRANRVALKARR
ncbi:MAG TPA: helix-turn-helix domain-containing protein [Solirubrobacterales bacterium]|nr:helix-turn-helix domain-containing protein [Solirubrobacterales bacterium]